MSGTVSAARGRTKKRAAGAADEARGRGRPNRGVGEMLAIPLPIRPRGRNPDARPDERPRKRASAFRSVLRRSGGGRWLAPWYPSTVGNVTLAALLDARPSDPFWGRAWVEDVMTRVLPGPDDEAQLCGWSVGAVVGNEPLVQTRPIVRRGSANPLTDFMRTASGCTIATFAAAQRGEERPAVDMSRYRRWVGVQSGAPLQSEVREALRRELPAFLARAPSNTPDTELLLFAFLGRLHERGELGTTFASDVVIRHCLADLDAWLRERARPRTIMVTDGRTLGIVHREGTLLSFEPPPELRPTRRWSPEAAKGSAPANLFVWQPGPPPETPLPGAERIAEGILSGQSAEPSHLTRE